MRNSRDNRWRLREAGPEDCAALSLIGAATFLDAFAGVLEGAGLVEHCHNQHSASAYRKIFAQGGRAWLAEAARGGAPIGYAVTVSPALAQARDGDVELKRIYVLSRYHGTGLASRMLDAVFGAHHTAQRLMLGVKDDNERAIAFYRKHGFESVGTRQFDVGGVRYDDLVMARPLKQALQATS